MKFGHVTFFWNGNRSGYFDETKEEYVEIPSDSGITFNVAPKMKALEIAEKARDAILSGKFDQVNYSAICSRPVFKFAMLSVLLLQVRVNLPNGDMVGHTGDIEATVVACKAADEAVKVRTINKILLHYLHVCEDSMVGKKNLVLFALHSSPYLHILCAFTLFNHCTSLLNRLFWMLWSKLAAFTLSPLIMEMRRIW